VSGLACLAFVSLTTFGCGTEEGILVSVSGDAVAELEFIVGVERGDRIMLDTEASGVRVDVLGRSLRSSPYELLVEAGPEADPRESVVVLVRARRIQRNGDKRLTSMGVLDPAQPFLGGELLRRRIGLRGLSGSVRTAALNGCYTARIGDNNWRWVHPQNLDCDPVRADADPPDCDDERARVYPGAVERCDGLDNDCDEALAPLSGVCFARAEGEQGPCREGMRFCEQAGRGAGACTTTDEPAPEAYCAHLASCQDLADPRPCLREAALATSLTCVHRRDAQGMACGGATVALSPPEKADNCRWRVFDAGALEASFGEEPTSTACSPTLRISAPSGLLAGRVMLDYFADGSPGWLVQVSVSPETVESCDGVEAISCE
jgi:hypothetical protein